jgi:hypothetical protein
VVSVNDPARSVEAACARRRQHARRGPRQYGRLGSAQTELETDRSWDGPAGFALANFTVDIAADGALLPRIAASRARQRVVAVVDSGLRVWNPWSERVLMR